MEMDKIEQIKAQIVTVAEARGFSNRAQELKRAAFAIWESEHTGLIDDEARGKVAVQTEETKLRDMTVIYFNETQDKHHDPNVGIREVDKLEYGTKQAMEWAKTHGMALKLDTSAFEKIVKTSPPDYPFVTFTKTATATIATEIKVV